VYPFLGTSEAIRRLAEHARKVVAYDSPVLISGKTGSGKGVLAAWIHKNGLRADEPFMDLNCAGLSREFLETELFGHEKGAFTGAVTAKEGLLEVAHRGTLFLDEIGDMDPEVQPKLLKVLEEKRFRRMGDTRDRQVDVRLITATHRPLEALVKESRFRSDLYFRISTIPLVVPSLQERPEDILPLARYLLKRIGSDLGRGAEIELGPDAETALQNYRWPGNVRELKNVLERAVLLGNTRELSREDLFFAGPFSDPPEAEGADLSLQELERRHIERVLRQQRGRVEAAARLLGVPRSSLYEKIKKHGIDPSRL
jgi:DNA-binding NtrC family response regulator